jgi:hypothetical protein
MPAPSNGRSLKVRTTFPSAVSMTVIMSESVSAT